MYTAPSTTRRTDMSASKVAHPAPRHQGDFRLGSPRSDEPCTVVNVGVSETDTRSAAKTFQREIHLRTAGGLTVTDITDEVQEAVRESGVSNGICCVYSPHTTCSVRVNEWERGFLEDFAAMLKRLIPVENYY